MAEANTFVPRRLLRGGHAQTLAAWALRPRNLLPAPEDRLLTVDAAVPPHPARADASNNVQLLLRCNWQRDRQRALTLVIVHGLEGSSESAYAIGAANKAWTAGMNVVRMNVRTCGASEQYCNTLYNSGMSCDVDAVVRALIGNDHLEDIAVLGFSMGANLVLKLAGEWGNDF